VQKQITTKGYSEPRLINDNQLFGVYNERVRTLSSRDANVNNNRLHHRETASAALREIASCFKDLRKGRLSFCRNRTARHIACTESGALEIFR